MLRAPIDNRQLSASEEATLSGVSQVAYYDSGGWKGNYVGEVVWLSKGDRTKTWLS